MKTVAPLPAPLAFASSREMSRDRLPRTSRWRVLASLALVGSAISVGAGCSSAESNGTSDASVGAETSDAGATGDGATGTPTIPSTPKAACEALIACMADVAPTSVGGLVTLYGDASNCWKGGASDAEACGKACKKSLEEQKQCLAPTIERSFAAVCDLGSGEPLRFDAELSYDARKGGKLVFHPVAYDATTYTSGMGLVEAPGIPLTADTQGGKGTSTVPFDFPSRALPNFGGPVRVASQTVERLRPAESQASVLCSDTKLTLSSPSTDLRGSCMYFPLADGAAFPRPSSSDIRSCTVRQAGSGSGG
jgi:hypothetical protein